MCNANGQDDGMIRAASSFLKVDMSAVVEAMKSKENRWEALQLFGHIPSRNELATLFVERHIGEFRKDHPLRIPCIPSMVQEQLAA